MMMNERIKQLTELSKTPKTMMVDGVLQSVVTIDAERFAELIVRECVEVMKQHSFHQRTQIAVLEHFGVEG